MDFYSSEKKQRLTMSQAIVKYLQAQYSEYDGEQQRFIQGMWGIFGHGNVSGMSLAALVNVSWVASGPAPDFRHQAQRITSRSPGLMFGKPFP